ncbi:MAG: hypothetical protein N2039_00040, partial [Gemmataceae bacterium]|nr:hypothetical protein [Gemmataceae bacterium]
MTNRVHLNERFWVVQDANYNATALFDNAGKVVERYAYDPFGQVTVLDAGWNVLTASAFGWLYLHQGGRFDAKSGLYHFRRPDDSPALGRWTSLACWFAASWLRGNFRVQFVRILG